MILSAKMAACEVCGAESFEKHDGFMYCSICQTQSQEFHEQEYEYQEANIVRRHKTSSTKKVTRKRQRDCDDGDWTSWEAFNYILHGMVQELKQIIKERDFEILVFKLWAAYLRECKVAFTSRYKEQLPKLGFCFKQRDARVLYNVDVTPSKASGVTRKKKKERPVLKSPTKSNSSISSHSKRSLAHKKSKLVASDYEEHLSLSILGESSLADESLDSLKRSTDEEMSEDSSGTEKSLVKSYKEMLTKKDYKLYVNSMKSRRRFKQAKKQIARDVHFPGKNKLLSIIHLALLLSGSEIQLGDLLRFIREGHLSFAKVTHFLPKEMKFSKKDSTFVDVISDSLMPTHLRQRQVCSQLAWLLKVKTIPTPNMGALVERYCCDLNLPDEIKIMSGRLLEIFVPASSTPRCKSLLPSYEAWAMISVILVMKLLFGLNGRTEMFLSYLARSVNSQKTGSENSLFVFEDWQKFIECRKGVLIDFHYPTREQLRKDGGRSSKKFLAVLMKESKDEYRQQRFIPYSKYYMAEKLSDGLKQTLSEMTKCQDVADLDFRPSLIPQTSYAETFRSVVGEAQEDTARRCPLDLLDRNFKNCNVKFAFEPAEYLKSLRAVGFRTPREFDTFIGAGTEGRAGPSAYWTLRYATPESSRLANFKEDVLEKTPENFQWMITECSRMLEMNVRDVYDELLSLEENLKIARTSL